MEEIVLNAHAKINLSLEVLGLRPDGYHDIRSRMQSVGLHDVIYLSKCPQNGTKYNLPHCTLSGIDVYLCTDAKTIPADMSNLALRGIAAVLDALGAGADECVNKAGHGQVPLPDELMVTIDKRLPVAAGIAGGSGNAAACMLGLNAMLGNPLSLRELMETGVKVGADVPFSLMMNARRNAGMLAELEGLSSASTAAIVSGIGEAVEPAAPMSRLVILANPGISVSTPGAYRAIDEARAAERRGYVRQGAADTVSTPDSVSDSMTEGTACGGEPQLFTNDFESVILRQYPEAAELKCAMQDELNADVVLMSGSGPTMIAYYEDPAAAGRDYEIMQRICRRRDGWKAWQTETE